MPSTPAPQPLNPAAVMAAKWCDRLVPPHLRRKGRNNVSKDKYSSITISHLLFCLFALMYWFTCKESRSSSAEDVTSLLQCFLVSFWFNSQIYSHYPISEFCSNLLPFLAVWLDSAFLAFFFLNLFLCLASSLVFPFPRFFPVPHLGVQP